MDNLTHSLVGLIAGEAVARSAPAQSGGLPGGTRRRILLCMGVAGGNLPDVDLLWSGVPGATDGLGYLLAHRGYTHTVLGCAALAALMYACALLWLRLRSLTPDRHDRLTLGLMAVLGVFLHLGMDALNSYGVHPFWPWNNRWFYGDAVFIVEPLYWLAAAPLLFVLRRIVARVVLGLILLVACIAVLVVHRFELLWWGVPLLALLLVVLGRRCAPRTASLASAAGAVVIALAFMAAGQVAARRVDAMARLQFPGLTTLDKVLSPTPTHPLCWDVLLLQSGQGRYVVRRGQLSITARPVSACPQLLAGKGTAPMTPVPAPDSREMRWLGEFAMPQARLASLVAGDCAARELMQFARAPFAAEVDAHWILGDLRFDREVGVGMAEMQIDPASRAACRYHVPWLPPRADLLNSGAATR
jgi:inner membrane protein